MAKVTISEVEPLQPECLFTDPFKFKIRFNCIEDLQDDLDWKIIYVGSANSNQHDQGNYFIPESSSVIYQIFGLNGNNSRFQNWMNFQLDQFQLELMNLCWKHQDRTRP